MAYSLNIAQCPKPRGFHEPRNPQHVGLGEGPHLKYRKERLSGAQKAGIRYEKKVREELKHLYGEAVLCNPWISFVEKGSYRPRWAQPDALILLSPEVICLAEIKLKHTSNAWWQLRKLYFPLVAELYPEQQILVCEICKYFDPHRTFPEPVVPVMEPGDTPPDHFGVCMWKH